MYISENIPLVLHYFSNKQQTFDTEQGIFYPVVDDSLLRFDVL